MSSYWVISFLDFNFSNVYNSDITYIWVSKGEKYVMNISIIAVGAELLLGQIANTNGQYLSKLLKT